MYRKNNVPSDPKALPAFLDQELSEIEQAQNEPVSVFGLAISHAAPKVPTDGRSVLFAEADGTNWNPGSGAGLYVYRPSGWVKVG